MIKHKLTTRLTAGAFAAGLLLAGWILGSSEVWAQGPGYVFQNAAQEDPYNVIFSADVVDGELTNVQQTPLSPNSFATGNSTPDSDSDAEETVSKNQQGAPPEPPARKLHPRLEAWVKERPGHELVSVVVMFKDEFKIPRFPDLEVTVPRTEEINEKRLQQAQRLVAEIEAARQLDYDRKEKDLWGQFGARMKDRFWLVNGMVLELPVQALQGLAKRPDVVYIEPDEGDSPPPASQAVSYARELIQSDGYFDLGLTSGYIGLIDTGLRFTHVLLGTPSNIDLRYDCSDGVCNYIPDITDDCWDHGTRSAAILTGNNNMGDSFRGVTAITVDSLKVYQPNCGNYTIMGVLKALEKAIAIGDRTIVVEVQQRSGSTSSISQAADNAYDAGAVVVAANGNFGPDPSTVTSPANAHKVIGVGSHSVWDLSTETTQSRGPADDYRIKPDIQAPTGTVTASSASDIAEGPYAGTSGAAPYAGGAAVLYRNWLGRYGYLDPGHTYANMILSGHNNGINNTTGAGRLQMIRGGRLYLGKTSIGNGSLTVEIPINVDAGKKEIRAALWWPETVLQRHNDIDLYLIGPDGRNMRSSTQLYSIFEKAVWSTNYELPVGYWKVRMVGRYVPEGPQTVYWSTHVK